MKFWYWTLIDIVNLIHYYYICFSVSINSTVETILVTIHLEADWTKLQTLSKHTSCSPYMRELGEFLNRVFNAYLARFENKEVLLLK